MVRNQWLRHYNVTDGCLCPFNATPTDIARCLQDGVDIDARPTDGLIPLHYASMEGANDLVEFLIDLNANIEAMDWAAIR